MMLSESRRADREEVSFEKKFGKPRKSTAYFPLVEVPASKETLKYGGFLNCSFVAATYLPSGYRNGTYNP